MIESRTIKRRAKLMRPLLLPLILYLGLLAVAVRYAPEMAVPWSYLIALLPMVPGIFLTFGIVNMTIKIDDLERRILLEAVAFSFIFTLILLLSLGLLGLVGIPRPSPIIIAAAMCFLLLIGKFWGNWKYR